MRGAALLLGPALTWGLWLAPAGTWAAQPVSAPPAAPLAGAPSVDASLKGIARDTRAVAPESRNGSSTQTGDGGLALSGGQQAPGAASTSPEFRLPPPRSAEAGTIRGVPVLTLLACVSALALLLAVIALALAFMLQSWKSKMDRFARSLPPAPGGTASRDLADAVERLVRTNDQRWAEVSELKRQVADLQRSLEALRAAPNRSERALEARPSEPRYPVFDGQAPARSAPSPQASAGRAGASADRIDSGWRAGLLARFREAALDPSDAGYRLMQAYGVRGATPSGSGYTLSGEAEAAKVWAVPIPGDAGSFLLLPGYSAISNWSAHFSPHRQTAAADVFGTAFDLVEGGGGLAVETPAMARSDDAGALSVTQRGRLSGFRS